jgi:hypothetical protein
MPSSYPVTGLFGWIVLTLGTALLRGGRQRRFGSAGLLCLGLGLAAWRASPASPTNRLAPPEALGEGFLVVNGGLLLLGLGLLVWAAGAEGSGPFRLAARVAIALGAALVARLIAGQLLAAGLGRATISAVGAGLAGGGLIALVRGTASTSPARAVGRRMFTEPLRPPSATRDGVTVQLLAAIAAGAAATLGPHVALVFLGVIVAVWSGYWLAGPATGRRAPIAPVLSLVLVPAYWLLATIAGPVGLRTGVLHLVPLSPAAESLVAAALLLAGWSTAGLWPLHRQLPGALVGPVGALLLVRIALPLAPGGIEQWRPLVVPVLVVGVWHAAARARWPLLAVGGAFLGVVSPAQVGIIGAGGLLGSALLLEVAGMAVTPLAAVRLAHVAAWVAGAGGGLLVLEAGLHGEVVYTALGAAGVALLIVPPVRRPTAPVRHPERSEGSIKA